MPSALCLERTGAENPPSALCPIEASSPASPPSPLPAHPLQVWMRVSPTPPLSSPSPRHGDRPASPPALHPWPA